MSYTEPSNKEKAPRERFWSDVPTSRRWFDTARTSLILFGAVALLAIVIVVTNR